MIFYFILACAPETEFATHEWVQEEDSTLFYLDNLTTPKGFVPYEDGFLVAEEEPGTISFVSTDSSTIFIDNLEKPNEIIETEDDSYLFSTANSIYEWNSNTEQNTLITDNRVSPHALIHTEESLYWLEEGAFYTNESGTLQRACESLSEPYDLIYWADTLWISTQGDRSIWKYEDQTCTHVITLDDIPHRFTQGEEGLWLTTRSFRWPYGGWVVFFDGDEVEKISESPPEPEHIITWQNSVIWSSKQSITAYTQDPYNILSIQTTAGELLVVDDALYWTDTQGGRIGVHTLQ
jgi:hypothetical protein